MMPAGDRYQCAVPLGPEGLQYAFEATDAWGNTAAAPDVRAATPYLILLPPASPPGRSARVKPGR